MGNLTPNVPLIYESPDGGKTIYAREFNSPTRHLVGYHYDINNSHVNTKSPGQQDYEDHILWNEIRQAAKTNPALQKAMERVKILYRLSKDDPK
jgi:hypothetical protein